MGLKGRSRGQSEMGQQKKGQRGSGAGSEVEGGPRAVDAAGLQKDSPQAKAARETRVGLQTLRTVR